MPRGPRIPCGVRIRLLVLNRPVITALKDRYAERWPRTFLFGDSSARPRYLPLRSAALIARWCEIVGFESTVKYADATSVHLMQSGFVSSKLI